MTVLALLTGSDRPATTVTRIGLRKPSRAALLTALVVAIAMGIQGVNMLNYPYLEDDEGTYVAQAWAVLHEGRLAPYTYFYDHAPGGWIQIALWQLLTGGAHGSSADAIASGRVLMLLLQAISTTLVVIIGRRLTGRLWVGLLAALLFALSPYGLRYHRRVLLDSIAAVWLLGSYLLLLRSPLRLKHAFVSALALAVAVWSKEIAAVLVVPLLVLVIRQAPKGTRPLAVAGWSTICLSLISVYPLMALLKGELFPSGSWLGGSAPHVSLLCSLQWQASRGTGGGGILEPNSAFWQTAHHWASIDPVLVIGGTAAALGLSASWRTPLGSLGWIVGCFWLFLGRGGLILDFYLIPLLPFLALALAAGIWKATSLATRPFGHPSRRISVSLVSICSAAAVVALSWQLAQPKNRIAWSAAPVHGQQEAVTWVQQHLPTSSKVVIDMYMWVALHAPDSGSEQAFRQAHYYWKVAEDPRIREGVFDNDWRNVDYVISTPQLLQDTEAQGFPLIQHALDHSRAIARFNTGTAVEVRQVVPSLVSGDFTWERPSAAPPPSCMTAG